MEEIENIKFTKLGFINFIFKTNYRIFFFLSLIIGAVYFVLLRYLYPIPTYNIDSYSWISEAIRHDTVGIRPILYSFIIRFFKVITRTDLALIAGQYFTTLFSNLFLFFTCCYFFKLNRLSKIILYAFTIINPFYLLSCNVVLSDPFFNSLAIFWFTLLIWILHKPSDYVIWLNLAILFILFLLRNNAVIFPVIGTLAFLLSKLSKWKKAAYILGQFIIIFFLVCYIVKVSKQNTGTAVYSAFGGWQLANNALHIIRYKKVDTAGINGTENKRILAFVTPYFDTATNLPKGATGIYIWQQNSPLRKYMEINSKDKRTFIDFFHYGPIYSDFGKSVILSNPVSYINHFILPNARSYFAPTLEVYDDYYDKKMDTINSATTSYYHYKSNKITKNNSRFYSLVMEPAPPVFSLTNFLLIIITILYYGLSRYKYQSKLFNKALQCFIALYLANFLFFVVLAPIVLRYHIFILTLGFSFTLILLNSFNIKVKEKR